MSLCGYARVLRGQSPLPRCPRHGRGPFTPCHPRRSFNYSSLPLDASVYRPCTERITTITLADLAHFARTPSYIAADFLYPSFPSFFTRIFVFFLFFFTILKSRTCLELAYFSEASSISNFQNYLCLDQFPNISTVCRFK